MKKPSPGILVLLLMLLLHWPRPAMAQEAVYQVVDYITLPAELQTLPDSVCSIEFREQWIVNASNFSISKKVERYKIPCPNAVADLSAAGKPRHPLGITCEFSFLDPHSTAIEDLQKEFITMYQKRFPGQSRFNLPEQLLSVWFHEEWLIEPGQLEIIKKVKGFTPVIWQKRQTAEGEPVLDAETGYPVYYTLKLDRIDLRNP